MNRFAPPPVLTGTSECVWVATKAIHGATVMAAAATTTPAAASARRAPRLARAHAKTTAAMTAGASS